MNERQSIWLLGWTVGSVLAMAFVLNQALVWTNQAHSLMWTYAGMDAQDIQNRILTLH